MNNQELRAKYNPDGSVLRQHQMRLLSMLKDIDAICKKHNLKYWLSDGTLLGAVRHGGFIPWDDDLDIQMPMADFKQFTKIARNELPSHLALQTHETDRAYVFSFAKLRDLNSCIYENNNSDRNYKYRGIYVDIFPVDHCSVILTKISNYMHWYFLCVPSHFKRNKCMMIWLEVVYVLIGMLYKLFYRIDQCFNFKYLNFIYGSLFSFVSPIAAIYPLTTIEFEGVSFNAPHDYHILLANEYGNYMELPLESNRTVHTEKIVLKLH